MYRAFGHVLSALNICAGVLTLALMLLIGTDVFGRWLAGRPLQGVPELTKLGIVAIVWLQMAYTLHARKHLRADSLLNLMPRGGKRTVALLNAAFGAFIFGVIAYAGYFQLVDSWIGGTFEGEEPIRVPVWPVWLVLTAGAGLTAAEYAIQSLQAAGLGRFRDDGEEG
ncbi:MAG: TRAP transporter small permease [Hyphomicrobiaceae bacterium]|nr:TRAP transporter small permease [Hyphomicrobiaceae bacterium]